MKKILPFVALLLMLACNKDTNKISIESTTQVSDIMSTESMNTFIEGRVNETGFFDWKDASEKMIWSALQHEDNVMCIGYKPAAELNVDKRMAEININTLNWQAAKHQLLQLIYEQEIKKNNHLKIEDLEVYKNDKLPVLDVKINSLETIKMLRQCNLVRYAEPMAYDPIAYEDAKAANVAAIGFDGSGCGGYDGNPNLVAGRDYTTITPNTKMSWNYSFHKISQAWTKSTGAGIKVMVIDTGISPDQDNLGSNFNQGQYTGRTIEKITTMPGATSADDGCGHGTTMSGTIAAPRGTDGNSVGVAYNCNFVICRAAEDVYIDASKEVKGVSDAYTWAADNETVKIISMSLGRVGGNGQIRDAIQYAYGKGKLMFCAGGTSFGFTAGFVGVIFPASLEQVQAVTGVKDKSKLAACEDCHKGKQIDFVITMEQSATGIHGLSTAISGDVPTTVGGSSVATATSAGIAALVWSKFPTYTRDQVLNKMVTTASLYPTKNKNFGWGNLNADAATN